MINATPLAPLALPPNLPPSSCFAPLLPLDAADSRAATALSPAQQEFSSLQAWLSAPRTLQLPLHQVECQQEQKGRALQRLLLQAHLQQRGPGDVGRALYVNQDGQKPTLYSHRRLHTRVLKTIFGPIQIQRMGYCRAGTASIHPLDETLQLPARSFSYELQKRMVKAAVQGTFRETGERIAEITGAPVPVRSIEEVLQQAAEELRRDPQGHKIHVALTDGERALQILVSKNLQVTLILDLLHVLEKLWKAAYVFHAEGSTEAEQWVRLRAEKILEGHVSQVVQGIRQMVTKLALGGSKGKMLSSVANYLYRNRSRMHYDQYLARGLPIASGSVEGACKNLIKDRMERSGMRWTEAMAEAIVKLRAIYLSGDFDQYWPFHIQKDQERLHPAGRWSVVEK